MSPKMCVYLKQWIARNKEINDWKQLTKVKLGHKQSDYLSDLLRARDKYQNTWIVFNIILQFTKEQNTQKMKRNEGREEERERRQRENENCGH